MSTLEQYSNLAQDKEYNLNVDIEFKTRTEITPRILEISEGFGLGVSEEKIFTIYKDFKLGFSPGDVVFITGDSGGGKTLLLNKIAGFLEGLNVISLDDIQPDPDDVIIESLGDSTEDAVRYLSLMGLNDAFIFLRKFKELSDGQKYRFRLAQCLYNKPSALFIDEFCANLDRTTAKVIAFNLQKIARRENMMLFVATTHNDIQKDLNPSVIVKKHFMDDVKVSYIDAQPQKISFYDEIETEVGSIDDYKLLNKYHYKNTSTRFPYTKVVKMSYRGELVGVAVFSPPFLQTKGRTIKFNKKYSMMRKEVVAEINKYFIRGSRYVLSPKFRGCGLGQLLVLNSLPAISDKKYLEVITVMGHYNPVFEKAGMEKIEITEETDAPTLKMDAWLRERMRIDEIHNPKYFRKIVDGLSYEDKNTLKLLVGKVLHHPKIGLSSKDGKRAQVVAEEKRYKEVPFEDVYEEILVNVPKIYSGTTLYYFLENPYYKENNGLGDYL